MNNQMIPITCKECGEARAEAYVRVFDRFEHDYFCPHCAPDILCNLRYLYTRPWYVSVVAVRPGCGDATEERLRQALDALTIALEANENGRQAMTAQAINEAIGKLREVLGEGE